VLHDVHAEPRPVQRPHPPILIGGYGKGAIRRAVAIGQGWLPDGMSLPDLQSAIGYLRQIADAMGAVLGIFGRGVAAAVSWLGVSGHRRYS
jgi:alkanesulfonate monooxygenase SsuD/methylene tetrahydromethanopterin reductase-like flavin-dependent oxidoreductase (luciferase family)